jgi:hypothetical protein
VYIFGYHNFIIKFRYKFIEYVYIYIIIFQSSQQLQLPGTAIISSLQIRDDPFVKRVNGSGESRNILVTVIHIRNNAQQIATYSDGSSFVAKAR